MWTILGLSLLVTFIIGLDGIPLWRKKKKKAIVVFISILSIGLVLMIYESAGYTIPTPLHWIKAILAPITEPFYEIFK